jgi:pullulanase/glycogen debranching enzyme
MYLAVLCFQFDWEGDSLLKYPQRDLILYEMHVRGFTQHESSRTEFPGTYLGVVEKLGHLKVCSEHFCYYLLSISRYLL